MFLQEGLPKVGTVIKIFLKEMKEPVAQKVRTTCFTRKGIFLEEKGICFSKRKRKKCGYHFAQMTKHILWWMCKFCAILSCFRHNFHMGMSVCMHVMGASK